MPKQIYIDELTEFDKRVGVMNREDDFLGLPIQPRFVSGFFSWRDLPSLEDFVRHYTSYHVVSIPRSGLRVNHVVPTALLFVLADGDSDSRLVSVRTERYWRQWAEELGNRSSAKSR
jgi:hypothetical protein